MHKLTPEEEIALRRIANQSISVEPKLARRLVELKLAAHVRNHLCLTPLGQRLYEGLARPSLLHRKHSSYMDTLLDIAIPLARAAGIAKPDEVAEAEDIDAEHSTAGSMEQMTEIGGAPAVGGTERDELRATWTTTLSDFRRSVHETRIENDRTC